MTEGQGLGNQLFCYVVTRSLAIDKNLDYSIINPHLIANNIHSNCGLYFMDLDYGIPSEINDYSFKYIEKEKRIFTNACGHDISIGCYVSGYDVGLTQICDNTLLEGIMQDEKYFFHHRKEIEEWLRIKPEYDTYEFSKENLCVLHLRCSDYMNNDALFLEKKYWVNGMSNMKKINPDMQFMIITNDVQIANKFLPGIPAYNFDLAKDYAIIKNAKYLLLSNSSFTYFPALTNQVVKYIIAPKYWARHNVSDGYWASEQNIYSIFQYQDRSGKLFSAEECKRELEVYKNKSRKYNTKKKPNKSKLLLEAKIRYKIKHLFNNDFKH